MGEHSYLLSSSKNHEKRRSFNSNTLTIKPRQNTQPRQAGCFTLEIVSLTFGNPCGKPISQSKRWVNPLKKYNFLDMGTTYIGNPDQKPYL
jgi:hypothetical protein